jgi:glycosyltransferase involved in cell wall biosynthesis
MPAVYESIKRNTVQPDEVIVVDDGSEKSCQGLTSLYGYKYIKLPPKKEYQNSSRAYNEGIRQTTSDVCILCSAELIHGPCNFEMIKEDITEDILLIGSRVYFQGRLAKLDPVSIREPEKIELQNNIKLFGEDGDPDNYIIRHDDMSSGIHSVYKSKLLEINGYDEELTSWGHNDADIKRRLEMIGLITVKSNYIFSIHQYHIRPPHYNVIHATEQRLKAELREGFRCQKGIIND